MRTFASSKYIYLTRGWTKMYAELEYVSVGCTRTPHAADWSSTGLLAYAASNCVALAENSKELGWRVYATLHGHTGKVNCVKWISPSPSCSFSSLSELLSGEEDGRVLVWSKREEGKEFSILQELMSHTASVTCVTGVYLLPSNRDCGETPSIRTLIASTSSDSTLCIWERATLDGQFQQLQSISFGRGFALCLDFCVLPSSEPILICGSDDSRVNIFVGKDRKFVRGLSLSGHTDWVRDVECVRERDNILLASCSQDTSIRLWHIKQQQQRQQQQQEKGEDEGELKLKGNTLSLETGAIYSVTLESVMIGHEDWVYSVCWGPVNGCHSTDQSDHGSHGDQRLQLLSSSIDKTIILWKPDPMSGVWMEEVRVGEVGGNTLGFYGGLISPDGLLILAHDYQGGFHLWGKEKEAITKGVESADKGVWPSLPTIGGHFAPVQGLAWEPREGAFLLSVSSDQTTRLHAQWDIKSSQEQPWFEIARPQIHGYDMSCVAMTTSFQYASGANEKVLRVFEAPANFLTNLSNITGKDLLKCEDGIPLGASVPSLGLSNKAVFNCDKEPDKQVTKNPFADHIPSFKPIDLIAPPVEAHLLQNTLWPETQKLYGHGYEIYCIATSPDGCYVATACKATKPEHAVIRIWEVSSWKQLSPLHHHTLTITHLTFSHTSQLLLATSRDRCWSLWKRNTSADSHFELSACLSKTSRIHSRVIWSASWCHNDSCFVTGSRDKKVLLWQQGKCDSVDGWGVASPPLEFTSAVTALDFAPCPTPDGRHILAVGLESGQIHIYFCLLDPQLEWNMALSLNSSLCHTATVKQLSWKPKPQKNSSSKSEAKDGQLQLEHYILASCSHDNLVKLFKIYYRLKFLQNSE